MATLINIVKHKAFVCADKINEIKTNALKTEKAKKLVYVHADGRVIPSQEYKWSRGDGFTFKYVDYDKTVECINPKHDNWPAFKIAKADAAIWLTAARILKTFGGIPTRKDLRKAARGKGSVSLPKLTEHCPKFPTHSHLPRWTRKHFERIGNRTTEQTLFMALDYLEYVIKNPPSQDELAKIDAWISEKTAESEARRAECQAHS